MERGGDYIESLFYIFLREASSLPLYSKSLPTFICCAFWPSPSSSVFRFAAAQQHHRSLHLRFTSPLKTSSPPSHPKRHSPPFCRLWSTGAFTRWLTVYSVSSSRNSSSIITQSLTVIQFLFCLLLIIPYYSIKSDFFFLSKSPSYILNLDWCNSCVTCCYSLTK